MSEEKPKGDERKIIICAGPVGANWIFDDLRIRMVDLGYAVQTVKNYIELIQSYDPEYKRRRIFILQESELFSETNINLAIAAHPHANFFIYGTRRDFDLKNVTSKIESLESLSDNEVEELMIMIYINL